MPVTHVESTPDVIAKYPNFQEFQETVMFGYYSDHPERIPSVDEDVKGFLHILGLSWIIPSSLEGISIADDEVQVVVLPKHLKTMLRFLKDEEAYQYTTLSGIHVVDRPTEEERFAVVYQLLSYTVSPARIQVVCPLKDQESLPSVVDIYPSANWSECENWDMFGIHASDHPNLYRLLTDYGFEGHPLRKDFPLTGFSEVRYDQDLQQVVTSPVELAQEYRAFEYASPWKSFGVSDH